MKLRAPFLAVTLAFAALGAPASASAAALITPAVLAVEGRVTSCVFQNHARRPVEVRVELLNAEGDIVDGGGLVEVGPGGFAQASAVIAQRYWCRFSGDFPKHKVRAHLEVAEERTELVVPAY